ncbi:mariner Mos1 transposase [Trichonephila clavipes]|nr:mariner Mos1 transposase [Trichonephila clavipes]
MMHINKCNVYREPDSPHGVRKNASQAYKKLFAVYGDEALKERQCQNWFAKFRSGDFSLKDEKRSGHPVEVDDDLIKTIIDSDRHSTTFTTLDLNTLSSLHIPFIFLELIGNIREFIFPEKTPKKISGKVPYRFVSHTCIENHLKQLGYVQKLDTWVPHELKETHLKQRINSCDLLKKRNENDPFLKRLITGDEKWVVYNNIKRKGSWSRPGEPTQTTSKADIHQKKVLLSVWWDYKAIVYFELLPPNRTINSDFYIEQLTKLNNAVEEKWL